MSNRLEGHVFPTVAELAQSIDLENLAMPLQNAELIGIDESQVDTLLPHSAFTFLKSVAFRMYRQPDGTQDEAVGPILSEMRLQLRQDEGFESENKLLSYIRNNFIAYTSALTALAFRRKPFVVLHGPLVRAIGGFSHLTFDYQTARDLLHIDLADAGEFELPQGANSPVLNGDTATAQNLSFVPNDVVDGDKNLRKFNEFCLRSCGRRSATILRELLTIIHYQEVMICMGQTYIEALSPFGKWGTSDVNIRCIEGRIGKKLQRLKHWVTQEPYKAGA